MYNWTYAILQLCYIGLENAYGEWDPPTYTSCMEKTIKRWSRLIVPTIDGAFSIYELHPVLCQSPSSAARDHGRLTSCRTYASVIMRYDKSIDNDDDLPETMHLWLCSVQWVIVCMHVPVTCRTFYGCSLFRISFRCMVAFIFVWMLVWCRAGAGSPALFRSGAYFALSSPPN